MAYGVSQAEAEAANKNQAKEKKEQCARAQRNLRVAALLGPLELLIFSVVKDSPHAPSLCLLLLASRRGWGPQPVDKLHQFDGQREDDGGVLLDADFGKGLQVA